MYRKQVFAVSAKDHKTIGVGEGADPICKHNAGVNSVGVTLTLKQDRSVQPSCLQSNSSKGVVGETKTGTRSGGNSCSNV